MAPAARRSDPMFGLPASTTFLVFGFPVLWIVYTLLFLYRSRNWERDSISEDPGGEGQ